ncbi:MAG: hypothetical protein G01um101470_686 [Parcubacteria group bacterium Gr01-1014_70]|nr:MAG: hypothetical protein G01um101470_686 [Parcubacteria group bacterium Gr01-1014_70]
MQKDFDGWNKVKKLTHGRQDTDSVFFREQEIWWCMLGTNIGFEQDGKGESFQRPVLILKKFNQFVFVGVPLTKKTKRHPLYVSVSFPDGIKRSIILSQVRLLDIKRLTEKMYVLNKKEFAKIKKAVRNIFL